MHVRPHDEQREREPDAPRRVARLGREQPEEAGVERKRKHLRSDRPRPRRGDEHRQEHHPDRPRACAELASRGSGDRERAHDEEPRRDREQREAAEAVHAVHEDLREPLLIRPGRAHPVDRDLVAAREAVLDDLATRHEIEPAVVDDERGREDQQEDEAEPGQEDDEDVLLLGDAADRAARVYSSAKIGLSTSPCWYAMRVASVRFFTPSLR